MNKDLRYGRSHYFKTCNMFRPDSIHHRLII